MRIAVWHNLPLGGGQRALYDHVRGLVDRGHHVEVWAPPATGEALFDVRSIVPHHTVDMVLPGRRLTRRLPALEAALSGPWRRAVRSHCAAVAREITASSFDVCLVGTCALFATSPIGELLDIPSVLYLQEPHRSLYEAPTVWTDRWDAGRRPLRIAHDGVAAAQAAFLRGQIQEEVANARHFAKVLVNSRFSAESTQRAYGIVPDVCYLGIDPASWEVEHRRRERRVIGIGGLTENKRAGFVIESLARTSAPHPELHWVGPRADGAYLAALRAFAADNGVSFTFHEGLSQEALRGVLTGSALLAYAPWLEPFGYPPLECGAARIPAVGVAEGGVRETIVDGVTGRLVDRDTRQAAEAIDRCLDDPPALEAMADAAHDRVIREWTLDVAVERLITHLVAVAGGDGDRRDADRPA